MPIDQTVSSFAFGTESSIIELYAATVSLRTADVIYKRVGRRAARATLAGVVETTSDLASSIFE